MPRIQAILLAALGVILSTALVASPRSLDALNSAFATFDQQIVSERPGWMPGYQQAVALARSATPEQALPAIETLLTALAEQEPAFARVYTRYFALSQHLGEWSASARFLRDLARCHATPWVLGALHEATALASGWHNTHLLVGRLQAQQEHSELAQYLLLLYMLAWPYGFDGEAAYKREVANQLAGSLGAGFDRGGVDQLAQWRYQHAFDTALPDPTRWEGPLAQALPTGSNAAIVAAFSHYLATLIASNRLSDGSRWARARLAAGEASPALLLIADVLDTAYDNQRRFEHALTTLPALRQNAPDSLLLVLIDSNLRYFTPSQGYRPADRVLAEFSQRRALDGHVQRAIRFQRDRLAAWVALPGRVKRQALFNPRLVAESCKNRQTRPPGICIVRWPQPTLPRTLRLPFLIPTNRLINLETTPAAN